MIATLRSEEVIDVVKVVPEDGVLLLDVLVGLPVLEGASKAVLADPKHSFSVSSPLLLQTPSGLVIEVELAARARMTSFLEVVTEFDVREGTRLSHQTIEVVVVLADRSCLHKVSNGFLLHLFLRGPRVEPCHHHINDNIFLVLDDFEALLNRRVQVDVPTGTAVHEKVVAHPEGREDCRDGA